MTAPAALAAARAIIGGLPSVDRVLPLDVSEIDPGVTALVGIGAAADFEPEERGHAYILPIDVMAIANEATFEEAQERIAKVIDEMAAVARTRAGRTLNDTAVGLVRWLDASTGETEVSKTNRSVLDATLTIEAPLAA